MTDYLANLTFGDLWALVMRHKKKLVLCPLVVVLLGVLVLVFCPRTYRSEAKLFMRIGRESVGIDPTATTGQTIAMSHINRRDEIKSAIEILRSRSVIEAAVAIVGPDAVLGMGGEGASKSATLGDWVRAPVDWLIGWVRSLDPISQREAAMVVVERHLSAGAERDSNVIVVRYEAQTPQLAQAVCDAVVLAYQDAHMRIHRNDQSRLFFAQQRDRLRQELDDAMSQVRNAKNEMGISGVDARRTTLEEQFGAVELERLHTQQELATAEARVADLTQQLQRLPQRLIDSKKSIPNEGADMLREKLYALQMKAMDLRARYSDEHPLVEAVMNQLHEAEQVLAQQSDQRVETTDNVNPIYRELSLNLKQQQSLAAGLRARLDELARQKQTVLADLRAVNDHELLVDQLQRQADLARSKYFQYAQGLEEARIDIELENDRISNVSVAQAATLAEKPVRPSKLLVALGTFVLATAGTLSLVLGSEMLRNGRLADPRSRQMPEASATQTKSTVPSHRQPSPAKTNGRTTVEEPVTVG